MSTQRFARGAKLFHARLSGGRGAQNDCLPLPPLECCNDIGVAQQISLCAVSLERLPIWPVFEELVYRTATTVAVGATAGEATAVRPSLLLAMALAYPRRQLRRLWASPAWLHERRRN